MSVRAVRGATQLEDDVREHMLERVAEMVLDVMTANGLTVDDFISVIFTATSDLVSEFPAYAARRHHARLPARRRHPAARPHPRPRGPR